ncbi:hypothetical protein CKO25_03265 [Thiocapsa imhoffii]|uniref:Uncharacterized protein n=1 Tax=Thiocapsa imhoffii TaxID=382777 RepID=A0A9X0WFM4_9GAMM|nr:hypothetical protein [Thiocapsa imhoffii]
MGHGQAALFVGQVVVRSRDEFIVSKRTALALILPLGFVRLKNWYGQWILPHDCGLVARTVRGWIPQPGLVQGSIAI